MTLRPAHNLTAIPNCSVLDPEKLFDVCTLSITESCMGRFSCDLTEAKVEHIYFTTETHLKRLSYCEGHLELDLTFASGCYHVPNRTSIQSAGWDSCIGNGNVWLVSILVCTTFCNDMLIQNYIFCRWIVDALLSGEVSKRQRLHSARFAFRSRIHNQM